MNNFSARLQKAMELSNMKQSELCEKTGIAKSSISEYLNGSYEPKQKALFKLASALNVTPSYLMGIENKLNEWDEKYNQDASLAEELNQIEIFKNYLKSLGYEFKIEKIRSKERKFEKTVDEAGDLKYIKMKFEESFEITLIKDDVISTYSQTEFDHLKNTSSQMLNAEIYKNSLKSYIPETLAAHRTDDCTQDIDESALSNSVQRLKDQASKKHGVKYE